MKIEASPLRGVYTLTSQPHTDNRGSFARLFCTDTLLSVLGDRKIEQINHSVTITAGTVRGLHYQHPPAAELKIVRCLRGAVYDVAVDLRSGSETFLQYFGVELTAANHTAIAIPEGFAHGFQSLEKNTELLYLHTASYSRELEGAVPYNDPTVSIRWPRAIAEVSPRDMQHQPITSDFSGIYIEGLTP